MWSAICLSTALTCSLLAGVAFASSQYPNKFLTDIGAAQGRYGSCQAEAAAQALEFAFLQRSMVVDLSNQYLFKHIWNGKTVGDTSPDVKVNDADRQIMDKFGPLIPSYMYPEDGEYINERTTGDIPPISSMALIHPEWPNAIAKHHFREQNFTFKRFSDKRKYKNTISFADVKEHISHQKAVTLTLHGSLLTSKFFDEQTGLLHRPSEVDASSGSLKSYSIKALKEELEKNNRSIVKPDHGVAVIGFDDHFYEGWGLKNPGALFIRNSWNSPELVAYCSDRSGCNSAQAADLDRFRNRIAASYVPGLYAIPYDLINDYIDLPINDSGTPMVGIGGIHVYSVDYQSFYTDYVDFSKLYRNQHVPYFCNKVKTYEDGRVSQNLSELTRFLKKINMVSTNPLSNNQTPMAMAVRNRYRNKILDHTQLRHLSSRSRINFHLAKVPTRVDESDGRRLVEGFLQNKTVQYYCNQRLPVIEGAVFNSKVFPDSELWNSDAMEDIREGFHVDPQGIHVWAKFFELLRTHLK